jgi:GAF domain-containing protein
MVVAIRPKPLAFGAVGPVIIEEDVVEYLAKASPEQRWRILSRVALETIDEITPSKPIELIEGGSEESESRGATPPPPPPSSARSIASAVAARDTTLRASTIPAPRSTTAPSAPSNARAAIGHGAAPRPTPARGLPSPPPLPPPSARVPRVAADPSAVDPASEDDAMVELFRAMAALKDTDTASSAAQIGLDVAVHAVPCLAALAHLRDPATGDMMIAHAQGPHAEQLLGTRLRGDPLLGRAALAGKPMLVTYGSEPGAEKTRCARHALFDPWSVVLVPLVHGGELLGMLEMIDPIVGNPFDEDVQAALGYVATRLALFLAERASGSSR